MAEEADGIGDVATVLQLIRLGDDRQQPLEQKEIEELVDNSDPMELWRGCISLLQGWLRGRTQPEVLEAVVRRLRRLGRFPEDTLAAIGEGLQAATAPDTAITWRRQRQLEPIPAVEIGAWLYTVWLVADLIDHAQGKGTVAKATFAAIDRLAEKANEGNRRCGFCDAHQDQTNFLVASDSVYICDRCVGIQLARPLPDDLPQDDRRCSFCGHPDRPMALGAKARICEVCLRASREAIRGRRRGDTGSSSGRPLSS
jgi:hypothetical protein